MRLHLLDTVAGKVPLAATLVADILENSWATYFATHVAGEVRLVDLNGLACVLAGLAEGGLLDCDGALGLLAGSGHLAVVDNALIWCV